ncbi:hypothetical protein [Nocardia sp. NPDC051570]|uniref:hypothetical protein n=1 Tax=Nocardia sp. NPDC051570 TaxID=3364324 RepID=UPI0037B08191
MSERKPSFGDDLSTVIAIVTTEHFALQGTQASITSEAVGRASMYLTTLSMAMVALSFAGQATHYQGDFLVFSTVTLVALFFLGLVTFERTLQISIDDHQAARRANRIRQLYLELAPGLSRYLAPPAADNEISTILYAAGIKSNQTQLLLTIAGMVSVVNSIVAGVLVGALAFHVTSRPSPLAVGLGVVTFTASVLIHQRVQLRKRLNATNPLALSDDLDEDQSI